MSQEATMGQAPFSPAEEMLVEDAETLRIMAHPLRIRIRELLLEPRTVKQLGLALNKPPTKLYYHVNLLEKHGLIVMVASRLVSGIVEKRYQIAARTVRISRDLLAPQSGGSALWMFDSLWNDLKSDLADSVAAGVAQTSKDAPRHHAASMGVYTLHLTDEQAASLHARLMHLIEEYDALSAGQTSHPEAQVYRLMSVLFPTLRHDMD